ncbi:hypothetical protein [Burkholderia sp. MSMB1078WGS]|uniref:hypothetical protein n=1 Tax=Burkholderia sp. MSMB1078WGS TaxID=1637900 RepID=UPI00211D8713|nr:hypothetical protein [Burkholderia sp. MSMB1078WGS]
MQRRTASRDDRPSTRRRGHASTTLVATLDRDAIGLHDASAIRAFPKRAAADMQRMPRGRIQVSNFETACRMIVENVGVLPAGTARRHAKTMALRLVALEGDRASAGCRSASPIPMCCSASHAISSACSSRMRVVSRTNRIRTVRAAIGDLRADSAAPTRQIPLRDFRLTILYSPLATLRERLLAESRRSGHRCRPALPDRPA